MKTSEDCLFCKIIAEKIPAYKVYENDHVFAMMDIFPNSKGHMLVLSKEHAPELGGLSETALVELMKAVNKLSPALVEALQAKGLHTMINSGCVQEISHVHVHLIPVYDEGSPIGGKHPELAKQVESVHAELMEKLNL